MLKLINTVKDWKIVYSALKQVLFVVVVVVFQRYDNDEAVI